MRQQPSSSSHRTLSRRIARIAIFCVVIHAAPLLAQSASASQPAPTDAQRMADIEHRLNDVTTTLTQTQQALEQSLAEIKRLRAELDALQSRTAAVETTAPATAAITDDLKAIHEQQDTQQAEIKQHEQIKVETVSKYPVRITGLILFNTFANAGVVDDAQLPSLALPRGTSGSHGSVGATLRQSVLGIDATGPRIGGSRSSAQLSADFFGGTSSNTSGYTTAAGVFRLRQATVNLDWDKTTVQVGVTEPLFAALSPTSYATVAQPALSSSGNLWSWSPQLRVEQRIPFSGTRHLALEPGLIDPGSSNYYTTQLVNPIEASRRPGVEGRISWHADGPSSATPKPFVLGFSSYSSNQFYSTTLKIHSWAVTGDWQIPLFKRIEITGEAYRGRALGDFGGGAYKDILTGTDAVTGIARSTGVDVVGGWTQFKYQSSPLFEANAAFGIDDALSRDFDGLVLTTTTTPLEQYARNNSFIGNLIFRPKTYLIFSPEYRHIQSWRYTGPSNVANVFTITVGYQF